MTDEDRAELDLLKKRLSIDEYNLEIECREQPILYMDVVEIVSEAKARAVSLKKHAEFIKSDLYIKVLKDPGNYSLAKTTDSSINAIVTIQKEYREAVKDFIEADELANALFGLQVSVEQRKSMIKDLVSLFIHQYYSSKNLTSEEGGMNKVAEEQIMEKRAELARRREVGDRIEDSEV